MIKLTLDKALEKRGISRYRLSKLTGIQFQVVDKYYKNKVVRYDSYILERICLALDCGIEDIIEVTKE
ncbi:MAG: helix-turn-helix transcriptional regulator [Clostridia bacterium]|nr:helix-turn-helix transcriptional regulator [Clostridia bacterium]